MDSIRGTTIQGNYPPMRRKHKNPIDSIFKSIGDSFLTFVDQTSSIQLINKPTIKQSEEAIQEHYKKIHTIIDTMDQHLSRRLQNHQNQVFLLVKSEIEQMRQETKIMVEKLNEAIMKKNTEDQIWKLCNQLDYFKSQTYNLFKENKAVRQEIKELRKQIKEYEIELQNTDRVMQKLKRKNMKNKLILSKTTEFKQGMPSSSCKKSQQMLKNRPKVTSILLYNESQIISKSLKTQGVQIKHLDKNLKVSLPDQSMVNIKVSGKNHVYPRPKIATQYSQVDPLAQVWSMASEHEEREKKLGISGLPAVQFVKVSSEIEDEEQEIKEGAVTQTAEKSVQTDTHYQQKSTQRMQKVQSFQMFSKTGAVQYPSAAQLKKAKQIDFIKGGFQVKAFNQKSSTVHIPSSTGTRPKHTRYMTNAFNKSRIANQTSCEHRGGIKSTMK